MQTHTHICTHHFPQHSSVSGHSGMCHSVAILNDAVNWMKKNPCFGLALLNSNNQDVGRRKENDEEKLEIT